MSDQQPIPMAPDPAVPQRDILVDPDEMARRLSTRIGLDGSLQILSCERVFVSYTVGKRVRVVYRIQTEGEEHHIAASSFRSTRRSERAFGKAMELATRTGPLRPVVHDPELSSVLWTFPNDRRISNLPVVADVAPDLMRLADGQWTRSCLVDYYPETSAVVRCLDDSNTVVGFAKVHAGEEGNRTHRAQQALVRAAKGSGMRLARPLGYSERHQTLVVEPMIGRSMRQLEGADLLTGLHAYGAALATLHSLPVVDMPVNPRTPLERLRRKAPSIGRVWPDVESLTSELVGELSARWGEAAGVPVLVHGDTNENNALLHAGRVGLIDFDRASLGSAGSDIGNFVALLRYFRSLALITAAAQRIRENAFLSGYASVRTPPDRSSLHVHIAIGLAERAFRAVTRIRRKALPLVPSLLSEANALLEETK
jgi:Ser/Thr protein kinase RdoA (MazF antagonist)